MRAFVITISDNEESVRGFRELFKSNENVGNAFDVERFDAITPDTLEDRHREAWAWPDSGTSRCPKTSLLKRAYKTAVVDKRISCAVSHLELWKAAILFDEPILVLEHDAVFVRRFDESRIVASKFGAVGINDPRRATRKASVFHAVAQARPEEIQAVPTVDREEIPQGLAGASAYVIKPWAAHEAVQMVNKVGLWPNDALLCKQLFPWLGVTRTYYTRVQGLKSTTSK
jgi:GR25 family glycosyltransferase involved in LPS biosynthesis